MIINTTTVTELLTEYLEEKEALDYFKEELIANGGFNKTGDLLNNTEVLWSLYQDRYIHDIIALSFDWSKTELLTPYWIQIDNGWRELLHNMGMTETNSLFSINKNKGGAL